MLRKRRTWPASSRRWGFSSGNFSSRTENNSPRLVAAHAIEPMPAVCRRRAVGICTVITIEGYPQRLKPPLIFRASRRGSKPRPFKATQVKKTQALHSHRGCHLFGDFDGVERFVEILLELCQLGCDRSLRLIDSREHVGCFQAISGDAYHGRFLRQDSVLAIELTRCADRDTAGGLGEDAFGFRQQADRIDDLGIAHILAPSAALLDGLDGVVAVGGIADGERTRDGRRLLRIDLRAASLHSRRNRRASGSLRSEELYLLLFDQAELGEFIER